MDEHGPGWRLRSARARLGLTEEAFAAEMRRWADLHDEPRPDITAETVAEWEGGLRPLDLGAVRLLWLVLEVPHADRPDLAWQMGVDVWTLYRPWRPAGEDVLRPRRYEMLRYLASLGSPFALDPEHLDATLRETTGVDRRLVEKLSAQARQFPRLWGRGPGHAIRQHMHGHLQTIRALVDRPMPSGSRRELEAAAATTATIAGLISIVVDRPEDAAVYLRLAETFADRAGDTEVEALALMFASYLASAVEPAAERPDPPRARALLGAAERLVRPESAPIARAWVLLRLAEEHAWNRDELGAFRLVDEAGSLGSTGEIPADGLCSGWTRQTHVTFQGEVATMCGRHATAIALLETALATLGPTAVATRPRALVDLAGAHAQRGEVDRSCELLSGALVLARQAGLSERVQRVVGVRERHLSRHASEPAVRRLDEELAATR